ncbi:hypothetical protein GCM10009761_15750 [Agromyces terreus]
MTGTKNVKLAKIDTMPSTRLEMLNPFVSLTGATFGVVAVAVAVAVVMEPAPVSVVIPRYGRRAPRDIR